MTAAVIKVVPRDQRQAMIADWARAAFGLPFVDTWAEWRSSPNNHAYPVNA